MKNPGEKAMALVDGQLAPAEVPDLVRELARSPALVAELQAYLATAGSRIAEPFEAKRGEPLPARLVDTVMRAPATGSGVQQPREAPIVQHARGLLERLQRRHRVPAWSLAAGPALAAALVAFGAWLATPPAGRGDLVQANLMLALERTESGKDAALVALRPVLSFKSKAAAWCRQYELRYATRQASHGLACRNDGGRWDVLAATPPAGTGFRPAGSGERKAIDELVTAMIVDQPLSRADEAARIGKGWSRL
jgi:hypothetical protein